MNWFVLLCFRNFINRNLIFCLENELLWSNKSDSLVESIFASALLAYNVLLPKISKDSSQPEAVGPECPMERS